MHRRSPRLVAGRRPRPGPGRARRVRRVGEETRCPAPTRLPSPSRPTSRHRRPRAVGAAARFRRAAAPTTPSTAGFRRCGRPIPSSRCPADYIPGDMSAAGWPRAGPGPCYGGASPTTTGSSRCTATPGMTLEEGTYITREGRPRCALKIDCGAGAIRRYSRLISFKRCELDPGELVGAGRALGDPEPALVEVHQHRVDGLRALERTHRARRRAGRSRSGSSGGRAGSWPGRRRSDLARLAAGPASSRRARAARNSVEPPKSLTRSRTGSSGLQVVGVCEHPARPDAASPPSPGTSSRSISSPPAGPAWPSRRFIEALRGLGTTALSARPRVSVFEGGAEHHVVRHARGPPDVAPSRSVVEHVDADAEAGRVEARPWRACRPRSARRPGARARRWCSAAPSRSRWSGCQSQFCAISMWPRRRVRAERAEHRAAAVRAVRAACRRSARCGR